jgi:hypothetical protein
LKALIGVVVLTLTFFLSSIAAWNINDSCLLAEAQSPQSTIKATISGKKKTGSTGRRRMVGQNDEIGSTDRYKTADAVDNGHNKQGRLLTIRQKHIFVLGLGAGEKR